MQHVEYLMGRQYCFQFRGSINAMTYEPLIFIRLLEVVKVHVYAKLYQASAAVHKSIVFTEKNNSAENDTVVVSADSSDLVRYNVNIWQRPQIYLCCQFTAKPLQIATRFLLTAYRNLPSPCLWVPLLTEYR